MRFGSVVRIEFAGRKEIDRYKQKKPCRCDKAPSVSLVPPRQRALRGILRSQSGQISGGARLCRQTFHPCCKRVTALPGSRAGHIHEFVIFEKWIFGAIIECRDGASLLRPGSPPNRNRFRKPRFPPVRGFLFAQASGPGRRAATMPQIIAMIR